MENEQTENLVASHGYLLMKCLLLFFALIVHSDIEWETVSIYRISTGWTVWTQRAEVHGKTVSRQFMFSPAYFTFARNRDHLMKIVDSYKDRLSRIGK